MDLLVAFNNAMSHGTLVGALGLFAVALVLQPLGILVHELGHAVTARRFGARVSEIVAAGEGPAFNASVGGTRVRLGLGLTRDLRSREAHGWAAIVFDELSASQVVTVLKAGPLWQTTYGAVVLVFAVALPLDTVPKVLFALTGLAQVLVARANLRPDGPANSDGAQIAAIRARIARAQAPSVRVR